MSPEYIRIGLEALIGIVTVINWLNNRQRVTSDAMNKMEGRLDDRLDSHAERLARIESDMQNTPKHSDMGEIYREMRKQSETMSNINALVTAQAATLRSLEGLVNRMDEFWRSHGK